jgi:hypothetical protein
MKEKEVRDLHDICKLLSNLKSQIITTKVPHFAHDALFLQNDEITTRLINNTTEIKIHSFTDRPTSFIIVMKIISLNLKDKCYADVIAQRILKLVTNIWFRIVTVNQHRENWGRTITLISYIRAKG